MMTYMTDGKRDYKKQQKYDSKPHVRAYRADLVQVQRDLEKEGRAKKGDGKDNSHVKAHSKGGTMQLSNIRPTDALKNRSFSRNADSSIRTKKK